METIEVSPIVSLLATDKLSDEGVENLCKSLNVASIIQIITGVNHYGEKKLWYSEHKVSSVYVGGGHKYRSSRRIVHMNFDRNNKGVWPRAFLYFLH